MSKYVKVQYPRVCAFCGKDFIARNINKIYCSKHCKHTAYHLAKGEKRNTNTEPYHKTCVICGKQFDTWRENVICCCHECTENNRRQKDRLQKIRKGDNWEVYAQKRKDRAEQRKETRKIERLWHKRIHTVERVCNVCGRVFYCLDNEDNKTCSSKCSKKLRYARLNKRIPKAQMVDRDITLEKLYRRDNGKCYLCGITCSYDDWKTSPNGNKYPGDTYPEIEHVIPISRGGMHSWNNVRLACRKCNSNKSDNIISVEPMDKRIAYSEKRTGTLPKKTAQYTLSGELVRVFDSTAQIKRELGFNDKHIQNVCRETKGTGNAYGFHWEYIK